MFVTIQQGKFRMYAFDRSQAVYELYDIDGPAAFLARHPEEPVFGASSLDFPYENGAPNGFNAREYITRVLARSEVMLDCMLQMLQRTTRTHVN